MRLTVTMPTHSTLRLPRRHPDREPSRSGAGNFARRRTLRALRFSREAVRRAVEGADGIFSQPAHGSQGQCTNSRCFIDAKGLDPETLKLVGAEISSIGRCRELEDRTGRGGR